MKDEMVTYADIWADAINETYTDAYEYAWDLWPEDLQDGEDELAATGRILTKAAECLRNGATHTFTGVELDLVRHLMPAHEVHQSGVYGHMAMVMAQLAEAFGENSPVPPGGST